MPKIPETYQLGDRENMTVDSLLLVVLDMYKDLATAVNQKPDVFTRQTDGVATESTLSNGDININLSTDKVEMVTNHPTATTVTWTQLSP